MNIVLRDYQIEAESECRVHYARGCRAVVLVMPTGSGKTVTFASTAWQAVQRGRRVLILVHRRELLKQTSRTLDSFGLRHGLISSGMTTFAGHAVQVASVQTLVRRMHNLRWNPDFIIVDECHHAIGTTAWGRVLDFYSSAKVLGVTATPERLDGRGLGVDAGGFFDAMVVGPSVAELTARGYLSPSVVYAPSQRIDLSGVRTRGGDFASSELAAAVDKPTITGDAVAEYKRRCHNEPGIAFCASVAHAEHVAEAFKAAGYQAASIDGNMDHGTRARLIDDLGNGRLHVLTSCDIVSEGTDVPVVSAAILLRPTQSLSLCLQQMGRVLRPFPGKTHATINDHVGNVFRHGLPDDEREWDLTGQAKRKKKRPADDDSLPIRQCEQCYTVHRPAPVCPSCGFVYPNKARQIETVAGELQKIDPTVVRKIEVREKKREQSTAKSFEDLVELGRARGYRNPSAWASHVWQARAQRRVAG